jgi:hypothetical protein
MAPTELIRCCEVLVYISNSMIYRCFLDDVASKLDRYYPGQVTVRLGLVRFAGSCKPANLHHQYRLVMGE